MTQTKKCIKCGKTARIWSGHVQTKDGRKVLAGWCSEECINSISDGYFGRFFKIFGEVKLEF
ncbi:MAG: hypothetical protein JSW11_00495 [Candidatus Heimdallarchaeota archaeon]|nr:MAG: hypothetical protein JSW11_00495 [Candidatus Heimdallarchaeota archaeon]